MRDGCFLPVLFFFFFIPRLKFLSVLPWGLGAAYQPSSTITGHFGFLSCLFNFSSSFLPPSIVWRMFPFSLTGLRLSDKDGIPRKLKPRREEEEDRFSFSLFSHERCMCKSEATVSSPIALSDDVKC